MWSAEIDEIRETFSLTGVNSCSPLCISGPSLTRLNNLFLPVRLCVCACIFISICIYAYIYIYI